MLLDKGVEELQKFFNEGDLLSLEDLNDVISWDNRFSEFIIDFIEAKDKLVNNAIKMQISLRFEKIQHHQLIDLINNKELSEVSEIPNVIDLSLLIKDDFSYDFTALFLDNKNKIAHIILEQKETYFRITLTGNEFDYFIKIK